MIDSRAEAILHDLLESMNDSIIVDKDGKIVFFSESYAKDANVNAKDIIGENVEDVIVNTRMNHVLKSGIEELGEGFVSELVAKNNKDSVSKTPFHICNRIPIRKDGDPNGEILGAFAYTSLKTSDDFKKLRSRLNELQLQDEMMRQHINEVYQTKYDLDSIIGTSPEVSDLKAMIERIATTDITVTITGETGTGKELVAGAIHYMSQRRNKAFIRINCAAIPENLLESELFGYEPGSFTGALKSGKMGKFELANNGTLLLDEIGEMPLSLQAKLLRVLQEREIERIGGKKSIPLNVRVICSTNKNLKEMVEKGLFRDDLYYRVNVLELRVPALRERKDDIEVLCNYFVKKCSEQGYGNVTDIDPSVYPILYSYSWPGNIRELEHVIECACLMAEDRILRPKNLDFLLQKMSRTGSYNEVDDFEAESYQSPEVENVISHAAHEEAPGAVSATADLNDIVCAAEKEAILQAMEKTHYKLTDTAKLLNINRTSLYRKLKLYKIYPYDKG